MPDLVHSQRVDSPDGRRVQVLFYDDGSYRVRFYETPLFLSECFLAGGRNDHAIIKVMPAEAVAPRALQPLDRIPCPVKGCEEEGTVPGIKRHVGAAHPDEYDEIQFPPVREIGSTYLRLRVTAWWDPRDNTIHEGLEKYTEFDEDGKPVSFHAIYKPGSYKWRKLFPGLAAKIPQMYEKNPDMKKVG